MVILLRDIASRCRGLQGNFSVVRGLLGYAGNSVPGDTSLTQELTELRDNEHLTIHLKIVSTPTWTFTSTVSIDVMIFSMRRVYNSAGIAVIVGSTENLTLNDTDIDVGQCTSGQVTNEQTTLFNNRNFVGQNEIVVYLVRAVMLANGGALNGCAAFPTGSPGVVVASIASRWTVAHEVGHVLVGPHIETEGGGVCPRDLMPPQPALCQLTNIMTCCGTGSIPANTLPLFNDAQIQRIINSNLTGRCVD
jgi:hypothetical protein